MWKEESDKLIATFSFDSFEQAMEWMLKCSKAISLENHHPEWKNIYNTVYVELTTHDKGNTITDKDRKLAKQLEAIYWQYQS